jgi:hypothetical protein
VATAEERDETKQVEHEGDHRDGLSPDQGRQINHLPAGPGFGEGQGFRPGRIRCAGVSRGRCRARRTRGTRDSRRRRHRRPGRPHPSARGYQHRRGHGGPDRARRASAVCGHGRYDEHGRSADERGLSGLRLSGNGDVPGDESHRPLSRGRAGSRQGQGPARSGVGSPRRLCAARAAFIANVTSGGPGQRDDGPRRGLGQGLAGAEASLGHDPRRARHREVAAGDRVRAASAQRGPHAPWA